MNNRGFAISSIIYGILIIFVLLVFSILSLLVIRGNTLSKIKDNALSIIKNNADETVAMDKIIADFTTLNVTASASDYIDIDYNINVYSPYNYRIENTISDGTITYKAYQGNTLEDSITRSINTSAEPIEEEYVYNGEYRKVLLNPGLYKLEAWASETLSGSYASGYLNIIDKAIVYIYVGGKGRNAYNGGASHIAYSEGTLSEVSTDKVIISASANSITENLISPSTATNQNTGNGKVKITSLIYFTK